MTHAHVTEVPITREGCREAPLPYAPPLYTYDGKLHPYAQRELERTSRARTRGVALSSGGRKRPIYPIT